MLDFRCARKSTVVLAAKSLNFQAKLFRSVADQGRNQTAKMEEKTQVVTEEINTMFQTIVKQSNN
jgi:outer membrane lipopolysaccharide assembly protein LptE/RlpB